jgi:glycine hydroxymethyltransferase
MVTSGIRIGTPAVTTRGMNVDEMEEIGKMIADVLKSPEDEALAKTTRKRAREIAGKFPLYRERMAVGAR